jgi:endonuclease/exonuclease/phosphatase family metal-dependent hydrolase
MHKGTSRLLFGVGLIVAIGFMASELLSQPAEPRRDGLRLKVITYNVQFLPGIAELANLRRHADYRAQAIGEKLAGYDIIGLNEVVEPAHRKTLLQQFREKLGKDFHCVTPPPEERSGFGVDSGLVLVSRLPILAHHRLPYGNGSSIWKYGFLADGFAAKGALHARLGRDQNAPAAECLDVFITHLERQESAAREVQYGQFAEFIRAHSDPRRPALILGDFNTVGNLREVKAPASQYQRMMKTLRRGRPGLPLIDLWPQLSQENIGTGDPDRADGGERIDYIFLSSPADPKRRLQPLAIRVNRLADPKVTTLSDHTAVEAELQWGPEKPYMVFLLFLFAKLDQSL